MAREVTKLVNEKWWKGKVVTEILPAGEWWDAETYHQKYLDYNPGGYECPSHFLRKKGRFRIYLSSKLIKIKSA